MTIESFLEDCLSKGIHLYLKDDELSYRAQKGAMTQDILLSIKDRKPDILQYLKNSEEANKRFQVTSTTKDRGLLFNRFLWRDYSNRIIEISSANATYSVIRQRGEIFADSLVKSINYILGRHKVLNSAVEICDGNLYLVYKQELEPALQEIIVRGKTPDQRENEAVRIANELVWQEYNLDKGPLYRVFLIRISFSDYILGVGLHHAIGDAISIGVFLQEIMIVYHSVVSSIPPRILPVRFQYMDYLASMEDWAASPAGIRHINYWKDILKSTPFTGLLPDESHSINRSPTGESAEKTIVFDSDVASSLKEMAANLRKTLFCVLLSAYYSAIWRMTGQDELVVVALQAGRINGDFQNVIGNFAMEVAYKTSLAGNPGFAEITERVTSTMNETHSHQPVPLDWVRKALADEGVSFNAPGISILTGSSDEKQDDFRPRSVKIEPPGVRHGCHGFPVSCAIEFIDRSSIIEGSMVYRTDVYDEKTVDKFLDCFHEIVIEVIKEPGKKLNEFG
ncbi:MAG: hypothetical protein JXL81_11205 [Deltaproteobacteria bacterium]|nr:hypothetical protein [Deltaproteobacteria bacterium]